MCSTAHILVTNDQLQIYFGNGNIELLVIDYLRALKGVWISARKVEKLVVFRIPEEKMYKELV